MSDGSVRKKRRVFDTPGQAHELTFSCYHSRPYLNRDRTRQWTIDAIDRARTLHDLQLWAFVVMPTHVHLLVFKPGRDGPLGVSAALKSIKQSVSRRAAAWVREHAPKSLASFEVCEPGGKKRFRFWQEGGGYDRNITTPETAWLSVRYIHRNPVEEGLCEKPEDWAWSSARWYAKRDDAVLACNGRPPPVMPK